MSVTYDRITNSTDVISYVSNPSYTNMYPDSNTISIYGPLWLPRVYGKDLTAFEIASSGKIAITVSDIYSLDLSNGLYNGASGTVFTTLSAKSNYSFEMMANNRDVRVTMDSYSNDISIYAASNIMLATQCNDLLVTVGQDTSIITRSNVDIVSEAATMQLMTNNSNMYIRMVYDESNMISYSSSNIMTYAVQDYRLTASNDMLVNVDDNITMVSQNGSTQFNTNANNMYVRMLKNTSNLAMFSSCNMNVLTSNLVNISVTAPDGINGGFFVDVNGSSNYFKINGSNDADMLLRNSIRMTACNNFDVITGSNLTVTTCNMDIDVRNTFTGHTSNNFEVRADSNLTMVANANKLSLYANDSNMSMVMDDTTRTIDMYSKSNINMVASEGWYQLFVHKSNVTLSMNAPGSPCNMDGYARCNINMLASNNMDFKVLNNFSTATVTGNTSIYAESNLFLTSHQSNIYMRMSMPSDTLSMFSLSNMDITTSNIFSLTARTDANITASNLYVVGYCNINITASNNMSVKSVMDFDLNVNEMNVDARADMMYSARSNVSFFVKSAPQYPTNPVFQVTGSEVRVVGDLLITGTLNTSNITTTDVIQANLKVNDKQIILASVGSNDVIDGLPNDGLATNDKSGIVIDGFPVSAASNEWDVFRKSFLWNLGTNGTLDLGTSNITTESFWELQGGSFRITKKRNLGTANNPDIVDVSFGFRINESDELELVKKFWNTSTSNYVFRRVSKFGRII